MSPVVWAVAGVVVVGVVALLASYNRFVRDAQLIDNSWSNVDTELRRRYDLALLGLAALTMAPYAKWSSDRSVNLGLPKVRAAFRLKWADHRPGAAS